MDLKELHKDYVPQTEEEIENRKWLVSYKKIRDAHRQPRDPYNRIAKKIETQKKMEALKREKLS